MHSVFVAHLVAYFIDEGSIFVRADGEGGGKEVIFVFVCGQIFSSFFKTKVKASGASHSPFLFIFKALHKRDILIFILFGHDQLYIRKMQNQLFKCFKTLVKLLFWLNIGVVEKRRHVEACGQILNRPAKARGTTDLKEKPWFFLYNFVNFHKSIIARR